MRISDWSSDVCSSDLPAGGLVDVAQRQRSHVLGQACDRSGDRAQQRVSILRGVGEKEVAEDRQRAAAHDGLDPRAGVGHVARVLAGHALLRRQQIGRASCRERVCQYVSNPMVAVSLTKKYRNLRIQVQSPKMTKK